MPDSIAWNFNASAPSGASTKASGKIDVDAVLTARRAVKKGPAVAMGLQFDDLSKARFFALTSTAYDAKIAVTSDDGDIPLTGPLLLYGAAIKLFRNDLTSVTITSTFDKEVEITVMIGFDTA